MHMRLPGSIRINLVLVVLACLLPVVLVVLFSGMDRRDQETNAAKQTTLRLAEYFASQQEQEVVRLQSVLKALASDPALKTLDVPACNALLRNVLTSNPQFVNFALLNPSGEAIASALPFTRQNLSDRREVAEARATGLFSVGEYAVGRVSGQQVLPFAYPVHDESGALTAILLATQRLQEIASLFVRSQLPEGSFIGLADHKGMRLYRYPMQQAAPAGASIAANVWQKIQNAPELAFFSDTGSDGVSRVYAVRRVALRPGQPVYLNVFVAIPESTLIAAADAVTRVYAWWVSASLLLALGLAYCLSRFGIHNRLDRVLAVAQRVGTGDLSARTGLAKMSGSIGVLAASIDEMAEALQQDREAREQTGRELQTSADILEAIPSGLFVYAFEPPDRLLLQQANPEATRLTGVSIEKWRDREFDEIWPAAHEQGLKEMFMMPLVTGSAYETEEVTYQDGRLAGVYRVRTFSLPGNRLGVAFEDVTKRRQAEEGFSTLFTVTPDLVCIADLESASLRVVNPSFPKVLSYDAAELIGTPWLDLIHPDDRHKIRGSLKDMLTRGESAMRFEARFLCRDGSVRWLDWASSPHPEHGLVYGIARDVTGQKEAEARMAEDEARFRALVEQAPEAILLIDVERDRIVMANENAERLFGCSREELEALGHHRFYLKDQPDGRPVSETTRENRRKAMSGSTVTIERAIRNARGQNLFCEVRLAKFPDRNNQMMRSSWIDITERKCAEAELTRQRLLLHSVIEGTTDAVFIKDADGRYLLANSEVAIVVGKPVEEIIGQDDSALFPPAEAATIMANDRRVMQNGETVKCQEILSTSKGVLTYLSLKGPLRDEEGRFVGMFGISRDITEQLKVQDLMIQTEKMMSVGGLAAGMAHEINNPLSGILQNVQVLTRRFTDNIPANEQVAAQSGCSMDSIRSYMARRGILDSLEAIREAAAKAARIVSSMLDFSRKAQGNFTTEDIATLLDKAVELASQDYDLKKKYDFRMIRIERDYAIDLPSVKCRKTELEQVLLNLLRNAAQALFKGGDSWGRPCIRLKTSLNGDTVRIEVADNGPGMDESVRKRVFEPFFTTKGPGEGTGLGLSVSYFIITANHGGSMNVESAPGRGTRFIIKLPLTQNAAKQP